MDNLEAGIILIDGAGSLTLTDSTVSNTKHDPSGNFGIGVLLAGGVTGTITSSTITGSEGIGIASSASGALVSHSTLSRNTVAVHVQDGASLFESDTASDDPLAVAVSKDTQFVDNSTRVGSGTVPPSAGAGAGALALVLAHRPSTRDGRMKRSMLVHGGDDRRRCPLADRRQGWMSARTPLSMRVNQSASFGGSGWRSTATTLCVSLPFSTRKSGPPESPPVE